MAALRQERDTLRTGLAAGGRGWPPGPRCADVHAAFRRGLTTARPCAHCPWIGVQGGPWAPARRTG
jgi:hypothetical protein